MCDNHLRVYIGIAGRPVRPDALDPGHARSIVPRAAHPSDAAGRPADPSPSLGRSHAAACAAAAGVMEGDSDDQS